MTLDLKLFVLFLSAIITHTDGQPAGLNSKYRLSGNVKPTFYSIKIQPNLDEETFLGEVFMHIKIESSAESIEFHFDCNYLTIIDIHFDTNEIKYFPQFCPWRSDVLTYDFAENELIRIVHGRRAPFAPGAHILHIKYSGKFSDNKEGIFRTECSNNETALSYIVTTDFQPSSARKVFPCFDEPAYKAKFQLSVTVPNDTYNALSNMRVAQTYNTSSGVVHRFETTPPMSIYLLCLVISQHKYIEYIGGNNIPYRLFSYNASQGSIELLEFASKVIEFYSNYTKFEYVLPKIDFIGFDRNQSAATENWGLVTFNTSLLSKYDTVYDQSQKQAVIAHELAHFWFGNLVTNEWWDDIWLHEGVATFMALKAEDWILNNNSSKSFPMIEMDTLYWAEQNETTYPVINYQEIPKEIRKTFNDITYIKGATVLRMLEVAIGERKIQEVFVKYVEKYAFKTVTTDDFLSLVDEVQPSHDLREFMQTYLYQNRFPVISVEEREDEYLLKQKSFGSEDGSEEKKWTIPLTYITDLNSSPVLVWFYKDMEFLSLPRNNSKWIKLNYNQIGYYKANYSSSLWEVFIKDIENIEKTERDNLLLEAANQMEIELISCDIILRYLWELSDVTKNSQFNTNLAFTAYLEIFYIISERDKEATKKLTTFFQKVRARSKRSTTKDILREIETNSTQLKNQTKIEYCIDWLKNESHKYYNASFENKIVS